MTEPEQHDTAPELARRIVDMWADISDDDRAHPDRTPPSRQPTAVR